MASKSKIGSGEKSPMELRKKWVFYPLLLALLFSALFVTIKVIVHYPQNMDEGISLSGAMRVISLEIPYRDFFRIETPGAIWMLALAFKVFGEKLIVARLLYLFFGLLLCYSIYIFSVELTHSPSLSLLPPMCFFFLNICGFLNFTTHIPSIAIALLGLQRLLLLRGKRDALISGLLFSLSFLFNQNVGAFAFAGGICVLASIRWISRKPAETAAIFFAGFSIPFILFLAYLVLTGSLHEFLYDCFIFTAANYTHFNKYPFFYRERLGALDALRLISEGERVLFNIEILGSLVFVGIVPFVLFPLFAFFSYWKKDWKTWVASIGGASIFLSSHNRPDFLHLLQAMPLIYVLSVQTIHSLLGGFARSRGRSFLPMAALVVPFFLFALEGGSFLGTLVSLPTYWLETVRGDVHMTSLEAFNDMNRFFKYIQDATPADGKIFVYHWSPEIYFFSGRKNAAPFDTYKPVYNTLEQMEGIIRRLSATKPLLVIKDDYIRRFFVQDASSLRFAFPNVDRTLLLSQDAVDSYILNHYEQKETVGRYTLYGLKAEVSE